MNTSQFQVLSVNGSDTVVVGGGVVMTKELFITCAHVAAFSAPAALAVGDRIYVRFPFVEESPRIECRVEAFLPLDMSRKGDTALLRAREPLPAGTSVPSWGAPELGAPVRAIGFPGGARADPNGQWAYGISRDHGTSGWLQIEDTSQTGYWVRPGFSGFPIWRMDAWTALGVISAVDSASDRRVGFAIPSPMLISFASNLVADAEALELHKSFALDRLPEVKKFAQERLGRGAAFLNSAPIRVLADHLERGELVHELVLSPVTGVIGSQILQGLLVATDRRLIFIYKIPGVRVVIKDYLYSEVKRLTFAWGERLIIEAGSRKRLSIAEFDRKRMDVLVDYANLRIAQYRASRS